jgi:hypothetical protein
MTSDKRGTMGNPYYYGGPLTDPADFFGRGEQLQTVFERLGKGGSTSLIGERRSGKTSLLYHLMTEPAHRTYSVDSEGLVFAYINPELGIREPAAFYQRLLEAIGEQVPSLALNPSAETTTRSVESVLKRLTPRRLAVLLDEFQDITSIGSFPADFFRFLRGLAGTYGVCFVTATMDELGDCCPVEVVSSPFPGIFASLYLGSWPDSEFELFLTETSARSGAPMKAYRTEIERLAGRFPFFVQVACHSYFDVWRQHGKVSPQDEIGIHRRFADEVRSHLDRTWRSHLTAPEKALLVSLAHGSECPESPTLHLLQLKGYVVDGRLFSSALSDFILHREEAGEELLSESLSAPKGPVTRGIWVDKAAGDVWVDGKRIPPLTKLEYKLLLYLYDNANCICDKYGLVEAVWSSDYIDKVDDPRIAKLVSRLREDIEPDPKDCRYVVTVHGRGYKLVS